MGNLHNEGIFFGSASVNSKGQIVIPARAREEMHLQEGENLLVFGMGNDILAIAKPSAVKEFASHLSRKVASIQEALKDSEA